MIPSARAFFQGLVEDVVAEYALFVLFLETLKASPAAVDILPPICISSVSIPSFCSSSGPPR